MAKTSVDQLIRRANAYAQQGDISKAQQLYNEILKKFPANQKAKRGLATLARSASVAATQNASSEDQFRPIVTLLSQNKFNTAASEVTKQLRVFPRSFFLWNLLGAAYLGLGRPSEAVESFEKSIKLNSKFADARNNLGVSLSALGRPNEAIKQFILATQLNHRFVDAYVNLGRILLDHFMLDKAAECFEKAVKHDPNNSSAFSMLGITYLRQGRIDEAMEQCKYALKINPDHSGALIRLGIIFETQGNFDAAIDAYSRAIEVGRNNDDLHYNCAKLPTGMLPEELLEKLEKYRDQAQKKHDDVRFNFFQANILRHKGQIDESFDFIRLANETSENKSEIELWKKKIAKTSRSIELWQPSPNTNRAQTESKLVFILGPSRSGKSSVESLLCKHAGFQQLDEGWRGKSASEFLKKHCAQPPNRRPAAKNSDVVYWSSGEGNETRILACTHPNVIHDAHLLHETFNNVYFVFVSRDTVENAAEVFSKEYQIGNCFSYNAQTSFDYVEWYNRTSLELKAKMGKRAIMVEFEDILRDPMKVISGVGSMIEEKLEVDVQAVRPSARPRKSIYSGNYAKLLSVNKT